MPTELQHRALVAALQKFEPGDKVPWRELSKRNQFKHIPFGLLRSEGESILRRVELRRRRAARRRARMANLERRLERQDVAVAKEKAAARRRVESLERQLADIAEAPARIESLKEQLAEMEQLADDDAHVEKVKLQLAAGKAWLSVHGVALEQLETELEAAQKRLENVTEDAQKWFEGMEKELGQLREEMAAGQRSEPGSSSTSGLLS